MSKAQDSSDLPLHPEEVLNPCAPPFYPWKACSRISSFWSLVCVLICWRRLILSQESFSRNTNATLMSTDILWFSEFSCKTLSLWWVVVKNLWFVSVEQQKKHIVQIFPFLALKCLEKSLWIQEQEQVNFTHYSIHFILHLKNPVYLKLDKAATAFLVYDGIWDLISPAKALLVSVESCRCSVFVKSRRS